ncbi:hypothetical protein KCU83_g538, partial [Aureobasidium melanogenum]
MMRVLLEALVSDFTDMLAKASAILIRRVSVDFYQGRSSEAGGIACFHGRDVRCTQPLHLCSSFGEGSIARFDARLGG